MTIIGIVAASLGVAQVHATSTPRSLAGTDGYDPLQHAHIIVKGRVQEVTTERVFMADWEMADVGMEKSTMTVTKIRLEVDSVLRGELPARNAVFHAIGDLSPLFAVDHEYIVCARWRPLKEGGLNVTSPYVGLYRKVGNEWTRVVLGPATEKSESLTDQQVRSRVESGKLVSDRPPK